MPPLLGLIFFFGLLSNLFYNEVPTLTTKQRNKKQNKKALVA